MSLLAVPLDNPMRERLNAQAHKLNLKPEELAARAIRNILFFMEMKTMQGELRPLMEANGIRNEDDLYAEGMNQDLLDFGKDFPGFFCARHPSNPFQHQANPDS